MSTRCNRMRVTVCAHELAGEACPRIHFDVGLRELVEVAIRAGQPLGPEALTLISLVVADTMRNARRGN